MLFPILKDLHNITMPVISMDMGTLVFMVSLFHQQRPAGG